MGSSGHHHAETGLYLGEKVLTLLSLGRSPAIFGPRLLQFEAELFWSAEETLVSPTVNLENK